MTASKLIFVTGASGFIGAEIVSQAPDAGYRARLVVRRAEQIDNIKARYPGRAGALEFVVVPDLSNSGAMKDALVGGDADVEYILHVASPMTAPGKDLRTGYVAPAVKDTTAVLDAAAQVPSLKRVVITGSVLSLARTDALSHPGFLVEEGTNLSLTVDLDAIDVGPEIGKYHASKLLSHRAALEWVAQHKPHFDVITVHPVFVLGRDRVQMSPTEARGVNALFLRVLQSEQPGMVANIVSVRDVAAVEIAALSAPSSVLRSTDSDNRSKVTELLIGGTPTTWEEITAIVREQHPRFPLKLGEGRDKPFPAPL